MVNLKSTNQISEVISLLRFQLIKFPIAIQLNQINFKSFKDSLQNQIWLRPELRTIRNFYHSIEKTSKNKRILNPRVCRLLRKSGLKKNDK
jgi:hypothetical protein